MSELSNFVSLVYEIIRTDVLLGILYKANERTLAWKCFGLVSARRENKRSLKFRRYATECLQTKFEFNILSPKKFSEKA